MTSLPTAPSSKKIHEERMAMVAIQIALPWDCIQPNNLLEISSPRDLSCNGNVGVRTPRSVGRSRDHRQGAQRRTM